MKYDPKKRKSTKEAHENMTFMNSREARWLRVLAELMETEARMKKTGIRHTIVFQGSARINEESEQFKKNGYDRYYTEAYELSKQMTEWSEKNFSERKHKFYVSSGGGPGIMEAANKGAYDAGGKSVGLGIKLPFEQTNNDYVTPEMDFVYHYFFTRKYWFLYQAKALVVFPGGFGTMDELFEALTLIQCKKIEKPVPTLLYGKDFWENVVGWDKFIEAGTISKKDLDLFKIVDDVETAKDFLIEKLTKYYKLHF